jgi:hypothetical protein
MTLEKERKISFHTLIKREWITKNETPYSLIIDTVKFINALPKKNKIFNLKESKICLLQSAKVEVFDDYTQITGFFKSARQAFRPNLINTDTGDERPSPKLLKEGDIEKTHFCIKACNDDVYLVLEINGHGITVNQIIGYLTFFAKKYLTKKNLPKNFSLVYTKICKGDFLDEIRNLKRTRVAEIFFNKSLLGSSGLNYSNRLTPLRRDLMLTAKAEKNESITETTIDLFNKLSSSNSGISKVRIYGNDNDNNKVILDTEFIEQIDFLTLSVNDSTGEINTSEILTGLEALLVNYN